MGEIYVILNLGGQTTFDRKTNKSNKKKTFLTVIHSCNHRTGKVAIESKLQGCLMFYSVGVAFLGRGGGEEEEERRKGEGRGRREGRMEGKEELAKAVFSAGGLVQVTSP